jgi:hypothetical protein
MSIFIIHNVYYGIQLAWVKAQSRQLQSMGWINFAFCMMVNYY